MMNAQHFHILRRLLKQHQIRVNEEELQLQLLSHPSYPSLHSITGALQHFGISNLAARLPQSLEALDTLPTCFVANVTNSTQEQLVLLERGSNTWRMTNAEGQINELSQQELLSIWTGVVLVVDREESRVEESTQWTTQLLPFLSYGLALGSLLLLLWANSSWVVGSHLLLALGGVLISALIVQHELGVPSRQTDRLCRLSEQTSCDAVLQSAGSRLFGVFKLSDLSMVFFVGTALFWMIHLLVGLQSTALITVLALGSLPILVYSIYYQYGVVKKWCPLCLGIAGILILQALLSLFCSIPSSMLEIVQTMLPWSLGVIVIATLWQKLRTLIMGRQELRQLKVDHFSFKRNFRVFQTLHQEGKKLDTASAPAGELVFGNSNAAIELILLTNPTCHYCKTAHQELEQVLQQASEKLKLSIRFNVPVGDQNHTAFLAARQLLRIYHEEGEQACREAMLQVYHESTVLTDWLDHRPPVHMAEQYNHYLREQRDWCSHNQFHFTPTLFLNGQAFPTAYQRTDLLYFIEELEQQTAKTEVIPSAIAS